MSQEMRFELDTLKHLVNEDEWYNIPAPVKKTVDGLIHFSEKVTSRLIDNADSAHRKILLADDRIKKLEQSIKGRLEVNDAKLDREVKRVKDLI